MASRARDAIGIRRVLFEQRFHRSALFAFKPVNVTLTLIHRPVAIAYAAMHNQNTVLHQCSERQPIEHIMHVIKNTRP